MNNHSFNRGIILFIGLIMMGQLNGQTYPAYGEIMQSDLETSLYPQEKGAEAVVLFDYAKAKMIYNDGFKIEFTRHVRIKIFKTTGYDEANIQIPYSTDDKLLPLKACTFNLENDQIVKTDVGKKQYYVEKVNSFKNTTRFSFPNVRVGSVIEYQYTIIQDEIRSYRPLRFQRNIPVRYAHYTSVIPGYFRYTINLNHNGLIKQKHEIRKGYFSTYYTDFDYYEWTGTHMPAFQPEPLMPESNEYYAGVDFALTNVSFPDGSFFDISPSYSKLTQKLLEERLFGGQLINTMLFSKMLKSFFKGDEPPEEKLHIVYSYVQQHMQWNGYEQLIPDVSLQKAHRDGTGSNAEINLMLVNMLRSIGISADPVILSTRENGKVNPFVAIAGNLNYVICQATINGKDILLDATDKYRPEGILPFKCLNEQGWVVNELSGRWVKLIMKNKSGTQENYNLTLNENGELMGKAEIRFYGYQAIQMRRLIKNEGLTGFKQKNIAESGKIVVGNMEIENIDSLNSPLLVYFDITFRHMLQHTNQFSFFNPVINIFCDFENPWIKDSRAFPIDIGYPVNDIFNCVIQLPLTVEINEIPKAARITMPDNAASFVTGVMKEVNSLIISGNFNLAKTRFETNEYPTVREFFTQVNKKCNEMIIFKGFQHN